SREASGTTQVATARNGGEESVSAGTVDVAPHAGNKRPRPLLDRAGPLLFQKCTLARDAPAVPTEPAVRPDDPVAGDDERRGVRGAGPRHGASGERLAAGPCDVGGGTSGAAGGAAPPLVPAALERRGAPGPVRHGCRSRESCRAARAPSRIRGWWSCNLLRTTPDSRGPANGAPS